MQLIVCFVCDWYAPQAGMMAADGMWHRIRGYEIYMRNYLLEWVWIASKAYNNNMDWIEFKL